MKEGKQLKLTNAEKSARFRKRNLELGRTEMRGIFATESEQEALKSDCKAKLEEWRK